MAPRKKLQVIDRVWMLVNEVPHKNIVIYTIGTSATEVWRRVIEEEAMGIGVTKADLHAQGYRAKKVAIAKET